MSKNTGRQEGVDCTAGHPPCFPPTPTLKIGADVYVNGFFIMRVSDKYEPHAVPPCTPHQPTQIAGSGTVFANNLNVARMGDPTDCGDKLMHPCSPDVFTGD